MSTSANHMTPTVSWVMGGNGAAVRRVTVSRGAAENSTRGGSEALGSSVGPRWKAIARGGRRSNAMTRMRDVSYRMFISVSPDLWSHTALPPRQIFSGSRQ